MLLELRRVCEFYDVDTKETGVRLEFVRQVGDDQLVYALQVREEDVGGLLEFVGVGQTEEFEPAPIPAEPDDPVLAIPDPRPVAPRRTPVRAVVKAQPGAARPSDVGAEQL